MTSEAPVSSRPDEDFPRADIQPSGWSFQRFFRRTWPIWATALAAIVVSAVLVAVSVGSSGPEITVRFAEGHGIKPGDRLRHRGIEVGEVVSVELDADLEAVLVTMNLMPAARDIAREGSRFWIERPRVSLSRVSGLDTVVGSKYVGVLPGPPDAPEAFYFEGMESPPLFHDSDSVEITVQFQNGHGLAAGDVVKHRGIVIGEIISVELDPKFQGVEVRVRLIGRATGLARAGSQFWIERPRVSVAEVRGLETLVGGRYLAVIPGPPAGKLRQTFVGLESPPAGELPPGGLEIVLQGAARHGLEPGTPVMYRGQQVGQIVSVGLAPDAATVDARVSIQPDYRNLVRDNSRFWSNSGLRLRLGLSGLELGTDTLANLTVGGVSFATPTTPGEPVTTGRRFELADQPESEWLDWRPRIALGTGMLREGLSFPMPQRVTLRWSGSFLGIGRTKRRQGWVLPLDEGKYLLGPKDLLTPVEGAKETTILEITGRELAITNDKVQVTGELAIYPVEGEPIAGESAWPSHRMRRPEKLESALLVADPQSAKLPLPQQRLSQSKNSNAWRIDPSVPLDEDWHGGCLISAEDGRLIGIALTSEAPARVALVPGDRNINR